MERRGLARRDLKSLIDYGLLIPGAICRGDWPAFTISILLLATLAANLSSPLLTGSISWEPSNQPVHGLSLDPVSFASIEDGSLTRLPAVYRESYQVPEAYSISAVGGVGIEWGHEPDRGAVKRVSHEVWSLAINSTVKNVTLPHLKVHSINWVENRDEIPGIRDGTTPIELLRAYFETTPSTVSGFPVGSAILVPNTTTNWSSDPLDLTIIYDTRRLILYYAIDDSDEPSGIHHMTKALPPPHIAYQSNHLTTHSPG